jgi:hypothetical protein
MNKGITTIENIAALKYCQEFGILSFYNIIINYPNEEWSDLEETAKSLRFLKSFIPPISIHPMGLAHGSPVYHNPKEFNIKEMKIPHTALWRFPERIWQTLIPLFYGYTCINDKEDRTNAWQKIFREWLQTGAERLDTPLLYYRDSGNFLTISDRLSGRDSKTVLEGTDRELYLFCDSIQTKSAILEHFPNLSPDYLEEIIEKWVTNRWMFKEGDKLLSLAVRMNPMISSSVYASELNPSFFNIWRPPPPYRKFHIKLGSTADMDLSINLHKKPAWLRRIKRMVTLK